MCKWKPQGFFFFFFFLFFLIFFYNHKDAGSIPKSKLKRNISHSLINMDFIGLVTWLGGKRAMKKKIWDAKRVFKGYIE